MLDSLWHHGLQHTRFACPSLSPGACSNSCPLSQWCHQTISSSVVPFSSYLQSFPASGSFPMSQLFPSGGQSIGASASTSVLPMNIQGWFPLGLTGLISLQSKGLSRVFSNTTVQKHQPSSNKTATIWDFPGGTLVKNPPCNAGDAGSIPAWGTKIPRACCGATNPTHHNYWSPRTLDGACVSQLENLSATTTEVYALWRLCTTARESVDCNERSHTTQPRPSADK